MAAFPLPYTLSLGTQEGNSGLESQQCLCCFLRPRNSNSAVHLVSCLQLPCVFLLWVSVIFLQFSFYFFSYLNIISPTYLHSGVFASTPLWKYLLLENSQNFPASRIFVVCLSASPNAPRASSVSFYPTFSIMA